MINDADIETMKEMRRKGATYRAIGEKWNIDRRRTHWLIGSIKPDPSTLIVTDPLAGLINPVTDLDAANVGREIAQWRQRHGLSQSDASEILDTSVNQISRWERNTAKPPQRRLILRFIRIWEYLKNNA